MDRTHHLDLPYLASHQAQKHVTLNQALTVLDLLVQVSVTEADVDQPPTAPAEGDRFLVGDAGVDAFSGHANDIAAWVDGGWRFYPPKTGWICWDEIQQQLLVFRGGAWSPVTPDIGGAPLFGINTQADATNRLAVKSDAVLIGHDDVTPGSGDVRLQFNRASDSNTASMIFATGYVGQLELALHGTGLFSVRRDDGVAGFQDVFTVDTVGGNFDLIDPVHLSPAAPQSGTVLMRFNIERAWQLEQYRNGSGSGLALRPVSGGQKSFSFLSDDLAHEIRIIPHDASITIDGEAVLHRGELDPEALRTGSYTLSSVPNASTKGAGSLILVSDAQPVPRLAYSDGSNWRYLDSLDLI